MRMQSSLLASVGKTVWRRDMFTNKPTDIVIRDKEHAMRLAKYSKELGFRYYHKDKRIKKSI